MDPASVASLTVSLFFILNPFASLPLFISVTRGLDVKVRNSYANKAVLVAAVLLLVFVFVGNDLMGIFGVTMDSFRVAGGIVLLMMAIELVFGLKLAQMDDRDGASWAIIASPVLTGPGMITAAVLFANQYGLVTVIIASILALF
ncbi:MAG: MarC family protein, partial [Candidatus Methanomethylophilaceae archaeon]|nr:MarC family protein [Candidatus Methanomethylophilaceae archaeon]